MSNPYVTELRRAGIAFDGYRELAQPVQDGAAALKWPLIAATNQVLVAQRWKRDALGGSDASRSAPADNVRALPNARTPSTPAAAWFLGDGPPAGPPSPTARTRAG